MSNTIYTEEQALNNFWLLHKINDLELSVRTTNVLHNNGVYYVADLVCRSTAELFEFKGFGRKSWLEITEYFGHIGLSLGSEIKLKSRSKKAFFQRIDQTRAEIMEKSEEKWFFSKSAYDAWKADKERIALKKTAREAARRLLSPESIQAVEANPRFSNLILQMLNARALCQRQGLSDQEIGKLLRNEGTIRSVIQTLRPDSLS